jgi:hypothetical protein
MSKKFNLYLGKSGQLAAMSEFLARGWNVATPEVDIGDDIFVVEDKKGIFQRVQVKSASAIIRKDGYSVRFNLPIKQVITKIEPEIYYVFMIRKDDSWAKPMIVKRSDIDDFYHINQIGSLVGENLMLYLSFQGAKVTCSKVDFTPFISNFEDFPLIAH